MKRTSGLTVAALSVAALLAMSGCANQGSAGGGGEEGSSDRVELPVQEKLDVPEDDDKRRRRPGEPSAIITRARDHPQRLKVMRDMGLKTPPRTSTQRPT